MWRQIELPQTIRFDRIVDTYSPAAIRMKNVYHDGMFLSEIERYEWQGQDNRAGDTGLVNTPLNFEHNLPNRLIKGTDKNNNPVMIIAAERAVYVMNIGQIQTPSFASTDTFSGQFADIEKIPSINPPAQSATEAVNPQPLTVAVGADWGTPAPDELDGVYGYITSSTSGTVAEKFHVNAGTEPPFVVAFMEANGENVEYRYCYTYYNSASGLETMPSPYTSVYGSTRPRNEAQFRKFLVVSSVPTEPDNGMNKIRIYRFTENVGVYYLIAEIDKTNRWYIEDDKPADWKGSKLLSNDIITLPIDPDAIAWHIDRMYVAFKNVLLISDVGSAGTFSRGLMFGGTNPAYGGYLNFPDPIIRLFSWGSYLIVFTTAAAYRVFENEGLFFSVKWDVPLPKHRWTVNKALNTFVVGAHDGIYLITQDEQTMLLPANWKRFNEDNIRRTNRNYVRLRRIAGRWYLEIEWICKDPSPAYGLEYIRIDLQTGNISGMHTYDTFLGWSDR